MDLKICAVTLFVLFAVCSVNSLHPTSLQIRQRAQDALHQQLVSSRTRIMPRSTIDQCHDYYYKKLKDTVEFYEGELQRLEEKKNAQLQATANQGQADRDLTENTLEEVCGKVANCKANPEILGYMDCVDAMGEKASREVWSASRNSSDSASRIRQEINVINFENEAAINATNRAYLEATDKVNNDMIACFNGNQDVPSATPGTEGPPTEAPAPETEAPPAPETEAPPAPETEAPPAPETEAPPAPETEAPPVPETEAPPAPETEAPAPETEPPSEENDQVEELERSNTRARLENFLKNLGKRL